LHIALFCSSVNAIMLIITLVSRLKTLTGTIAGGIGLHIGQLSMPEMEPTLETGLKVWPSTISKELAETLLTYLE
jgi:hypothetical protein